MADAGLDTYFHTPKDDLKHRTRWRMPYSSSEQEALRDLVRAARRHGIRMLYGLGPGLDIEHGSDADFRAITRKLGMLRELGIRDFVLLFDDIAPRLNARDRRRFPGEAAAQAWLANRVFAWLREADPAAWMGFCPTPYCGRMCHPSVATSPYLSEMGRLLDPAIDVFWTGPEIVPETIPTASVREVATVLRRPPVIWDNLHANDYDARRLYLGPMDGRPTSLGRTTRGLLTNPNVEFEADFVAVHTLGAWVRAVRTGERYDSRRALDAALTAWLPAFRVRPPAVFGPKDLRLLVDCLHLPHSQGTGARRWLADLDTVLARPPGAGGVAETRCRAMARRLLDLHERLTALEDRELLHTLYRRTWELKEEAILVLRYLDWWRTDPKPGTGCHSGEHLPGTYRGGLAAALQRRLPMHSDGGFDHRRPPTGGGYGEGAAAIWSAVAERSGIPDPVP